MNHIRQGIHEQLLDRRERLSAALRRAPEAGDLITLLQEVDGALSRLEGESFGRCEVCLGDVDEDFLAANPLIQYCLCELSDAQQTALEQDLGLASRIQWALLPPQDLTWAGWATHFRYLPAGPVSGDYCDLVRRTDGTDEIVFAIGDVSGKGVAASLLMAHLNATFRSLSGEGVGVADLVRKANELLASSTLRSHYATLISGRADARGRIEIANAGHCPPIRLTGRGAAILDTNGGGPPVGIVEGQSYAVERLQFDPGDALFLYTDGLTEARRGDDGEEYGAERLVHVLAGLRGAGPGEVTSAVLQDLGSFLAGTPAADDVSLLVLQWKG